MQDTAGLSAWKKLQAHLSDARACLKAGEFEQALSHVDFALAIDPNYLAASALRERIVARKDQPEPFTESAGVVRNAGSAGSVVESTPTAGALISVEGLARFEERARQRRIEKRIETARIAINERQFGSARAAIDELHELAPARPELAELHASMAQAERASVSMPGRGRWVAAGCAFAAVLLCATWVEREAASTVTRPTATRPMLPPLFAASALQMGDDVRLVEPPSPSFQDLAAEAGDTANLAAVSAVPVPAPRAQADATPALALPQRVFEQRGIPAAVMPPAEPEAAFTAPGAIEAALPVATPVSPAPLSLPPAAPASPSLPPAAPAPPSVPDRPQPIANLPAPSDERLVRDALQRYRSAYEGLSARSAQAVWPGVDEAALERAFDGLVSQSLTFDECSVDLHGVLATATCRGSARYTPKMGNRESRVEDRVWNFTLRKVDARWQIDTARVAR